MKKLIVFILSTLLIFTSSYSQTVIKMKREGGVSTIPCKVNGLNLNFIFDTGASDVTISMSEATFMLKNGYLNENDIIGSKKYLDAVGNINEGISINLRQIEIAGLKLYNVKAAIVKSNKAPLLLGQSAIEKLGEIQLDLASNTLIIKTGKAITDNSSFDFYQKIIGTPYKLENFIEVAENDFPQKMNWKDAKIFCDNLGDGWRLPTKQELYFLRTWKYTIKVRESSYWSLTDQDDDRSYWTFHFGTEISENLDKNRTLYVRAVRPIKY